jgi:hypothetical protein
VDRAHRDAAVATVLEDAAGKAAGDQRSQNDERDRSAQSRHERHETSPSAVITMMVIATTATTTVILQDAAPEARTQTGDDQRKKHQ